MQCEMCGRDFPNTKKVNIEGTTINACSECSKFGLGGNVDESSAGSATYIEKRLENRQRRMREKNVYDRNIRELADDYPKRIREARNKLGITQDELAKSLNEKKSIISQMETGSFTPSERLIAKLESSLNIKLTEAANVAVQSQTTTVKGRALTLGDLLQAELDKQKE